MRVDPSETEIPLQVGTELRIKNDGTISASNPTVGMAERAVADAVISYRFDAEVGEHVLRLLAPVADRTHLEEHQPGD